MRWRLSLFLATVAGALAVGSVSAAVGGTADASPGLLETLPMAVRRSPDDYLRYRDRIVATGQAAHGYLRQAQEADSSWLLRQLASAIMRRIEEPQQVSLLDDEFAQIASLHVAVYPGRRGAFLGPGDAEFPGQLATSRIARDGPRSVPFLVEKLLKQPAVPTRAPFSLRGQGMNDPKGASCALLYVVGGKDAARAVALYLLTDAAPDRLLDAARLTDEELVDKMIALLPDDTKNNLAAWVLGEMKDPRAIAPLVASLTDYHVLHVSRYAAAALARIGEPAVPALGRALCSQRPETQSWAVYALGRIGAAAIPAVKQAFETTAHMPKCHYYVLRAAREIGWRPPVPLLTRALLSPDPHARCAAAGALAGTPSETARRALLVALTSPGNRRGTTLLCIVEALGTLREPRALNQFVTMTADRNWMVRRAGIRGLELVGGPGATPPLVKCLQHADFRTRGDAAVALGKIGDPAAVPALLRALEDGPQNAYAQGWAAWALGRIGGPVAVKSLVGALTDSDPEVRRIAADALTTAADHSAVAPLIAALDDGYDRVRQEAAIALANLGDPRASDPLIAALNRYGEGTQPWVAAAYASPFLPALRAYAQALGKLRDPRAVAPLLKWMAPRGYPGMQAVVEALGNIGDVRAVEPLTAALNEGYNNGDPKLLTAIAKALGELGDRRAVEPLTAQLRNWDGAVRHGAAGALEKITGERFGEDLAKWQTWWDGEKPSALPA